MKESNFVKLVVYVPQTHANVIREVIGDMGAGQIGNYSYCSFSTKGTGRFLPNKGAHPIIGNVGNIEAVMEERIETICAKQKVKEVVEAIKKIHPYEEIAFDIYPLLLLD